MIGFIEGMAETEIPFAAVAVPHSRIVGKNAVIGETLAGAGIVAPIDRNVVPVKFGICVILRVERSLNGVIDFKIALQRRTHDLVRKRSVRLVELTRRRCGGKRLIDRAHDRAQPQRFGNPPAVGRRIIQIIQSHRNAQIPADRHRNLFTVDIGALSRLVHRLVVGVGIGIPAVDLFLQCSAKIRHERIQAVCRLLRKGFKIEIAHPACGLCICGIDGFGCSRILHRRKQRFHPCGICLFLRIVHGNFGDRNARLRVRHGIHCSPQFCFQSGNRAFLVILYRKGRIVRPLFHGIDVRIQLRFGLVHCGKGYKVLRVGKRIDISLNEGKIFLGIVPCIEQLQIFRGRALCFPRVIVKDTILKQPYTVQQIGICIGEELFVLLAERLVLRKDLLDRLRVRRRHLIERGQRFGCLQKGVGCLRKDDGIIKRDAVLFSFVRERQSERMFAVFGSRSALIHLLRHVERNTASV